MNDWSDVESEPEPALWAQEMFEGGLGEMSPVKELRFEEEPEIIEIQAKQKFENKQTFFAVAF